MDAVEKMAISEPLNARVLALSTVANEYAGKKERWEALGREPPVVSLIYLSCFVVVTLQNLSRPWFGCFGDLGIFWVGEIGIEVDWVWCED